MLCVEVELRERTSNDHFQRFFFCVMLCSLFIIVHVKSTGFGLSRMPIQRFVVQQSIGCSCVGADVGWIIIKGIWILWWILQWLAQSDVTGIEKWNVDNLWEKSQKLSNKFDVFASALFPLRLVTLMISSTSHTSTYTPRSRSTTCMIVLLLEA